MPLTIDIDSPEEIDAKLTESVNLVESTLDDNMVHLMNLYYIPEIKSVARAANLPQGFVDGIKFVKTGSNKGKIINTWGDNKKPLAKWFNYGTKDHGPLGDKPMHWKSKKTGEDIYAMFVRGVPRTLAMEKGMELGNKRLKQEAPKFIEAKLN